MISQRHKLISIDTSTIFHGENDGIIHFQRGGPEMVLQTNISAGCRVGVALLSGVWVGYYVRLLQRTGLWMPLRGRYAHV